MVIILAILNLGARAAECLKAAQERGLTARLGRDVEGSCLPRSRCAVAVLPQSGDHPDSERAAREAALQPELAARQARRSKGGERASAYFAQAELDRRFKREHRAIHGVEPICQVLPIAPSTYHAHAARRVDPGKLTARLQRDAALNVEIRRVYEENFWVYGVRKFLAAAQP